MKKAEFCIIERSVCKKIKNIKTYVLYSDLYVICHHATCN